MHVVDSPAPGFSPNVSPDQDVPCPLCGYNLCGLTEARCPECGAKFEWPDLLDPARKLHPYLFEHHPEKKVRAYLRTLLAGWMPRRFWRALHPAQPSRPRLLVLYWLIALLISIVLPLIQYGLSVRSNYHEMNAYREELEGYYKGTVNGKPVPGAHANLTQMFSIRRNWPTVDAYLDYTAPRATWKS